MATPHPPRPDWPERATGSRARAGSLSVVIPSLDEAESLPRLLADLAPLRAVGAEVVVVDGGSTDGTAEAARAAGATVISTARGRGLQLAAGATASHGDTLLFLHADIRLPGHTITWILEQFPVTRPWAFRLRIDRDSPSLRAVAWGANLRSRLLALPYGDQGLLIRRAEYEAAGGFAAVPLMEDVLIARQLRARAPIALAPVEIVASSRRWDRDGTWRRSARNLLLLGRFLLGASPESLVRHYTPRAR